MNVDTDPDICIGAGNCVLAAPAVFDQGDDGIVQLLDAAPGEDQEEAVEQAVRRCPAGAITIL